MPKNSYKDEDDTHNLHIKDYLNYRIQIERRWKRTHFPVFKYTRLIINFTDNKKMGFLKIYDISKLNESDDFNNSFSYISNVIHEYIQDTLKEKFFISDENLPEYEVNNVYYENNDIIVFASYKK